jgi:hypothetical protein
MTSVEPLIDRLYSLDELTELRRTTLRSLFSAGSRAQPTFADSCLAAQTFRNEKWLAAHTIKGSQSASMLANRSAFTRWRLRRPAFFSRDRAA